jgi:transposase
MKKHIEGVTVYGIDIGKNTFHVVGLDTTGKPILHSKFRRDRLLVHFANTPTALIGMESCPGSQWHGSCKLPDIPSRSVQLNS